MREGRTEKNSMTKEKNNTWSKYKDVRKIENKIYEKICNL